MDNRKESQQIKPVSASLTEQIVAALFDKLNSESEFDDACIEALKSLARAKSLTKDQQVLAALKPKPKI